MSFHVESFVLRFSAGLAGCCVGNTTGFVCNLATASPIRPPRPTPFSCKHCHWLALSSMLCQSEKAASTSLALNELKWQWKLQYAESEGPRWLSWIELEWQVVPPLLLFLPFPRTTLDSTYLHAVEHVCLYRRLCMRCSVLWLALCVKAFALTVAWQPLNLTACTHWAPTVSAQKRFN